MLAFILLVVLGGGLGLLAVSLAESPKPATDGGPPTRAPDAPAEELVEVTAPPAPPGEEVVPVTATMPESALPSSQRRPDPRTVPRAYTAVEGRFDTVAVAPLWRRLLSLCAIVLIAVAIGVGVAAVAAAVFGALAELLDAAIG